MRTRSAAVAVALVNVAAAAFVACGARSALPIDDAPEDEVDAGADTQPDAVPDALPDAPEDAPVDALPECGPDTKYIYLVTSQQDLYAYDPTDGTFRRRGFIDCPSPGGATPFSMGVDLRGTAYVVYNDGTFYRVAVKDASCEAVDFEPSQEGFTTFGMGFALDEPNGSEDTLYVAEINFGGPSRGLATIDTSTLDLTYIGPFSENPGDAIEMTSSNDGKLYGYFLDRSGRGGWVVEISKEDATILSSTFIDAGTAQNALAFAFYNDDFYVFTSPGDVTTVTRFRPADGSVAVVTTLEGTVVGAGVAPCDPDLVAPSPGAAP